MLQLLNLDLLLCLDGHERLQLRRFSAAASSTALLQVQLLQVSHLVVQISILSRGQLHAALQSLDALLVTHLEGAPLLISIRQLAFQHLHLGLEPVQLAGILTLGRLDLQLQIRILFVQNVRGSHNA